MTTNTLHELLDYFYKCRKKLEEQYKAKKMSRSTFYRKKQGIDIAIETILYLIEQKA